MNIFKMFKKKQPNIFHPVPETINRAVEKILEIVLAASDGEGLIKGDLGNFSGTVHHGLGRHIRNEWGLWSADTQIFRLVCQATNLSHADDLSDILICAAWHKYHNKQFDFDVASIRYHEHWVKMANKESGTFLT